MDSERLTKVYKIRDKKTGLFSSGGKNPNFTKYGKVWANKSFAERAFKLYKPSNPLDFELVEYDVFESGIYLFGVVPAK